MAFRLDTTVVCGEIDNRLKGFVVGKIWLAEQQEPITLDLKGNCRRDIAGLKISFVNPGCHANPVAPKINLLQKGAAGEITASRKVKIADVTPEEALALREEDKEIPLHLANSLYIEWFSKANGRVVIEIPEFAVKKISDQDWSMTKEEEQKELNKIHDTMSEYLNSLNLNQEERPEQDDEHAPMDEFEWEKHMRESDNLTDKFSDVFEKYIDYPNGEKLMAREMGWDWLDDALDADERGVFQEEDEDFDAPPNLEPNPLTEGTDWIRTENGIKHPLCHRAFKTATSMWHKCKEEGMMEEDGDKDLHDMIFQAEILSAKLAGALNSLAYNNDPEGGFVVAALKRALQYFDKSISASKNVQDKKLISEKDLDDFLKELFGIREEILRLMKRYRSSI